MELCIKIKSIVLDFVFQRFNSDCALCCGCMVLCRSLLFLPKKPTPTSLLLGKLKNAFTLLLEKDAQCVFCDFSLMETVRHLCLDAEYTSDYKRECGGFDCREHEQWARCDECGNWRCLPATAFVPLHWSCSQNTWDLTR
jgi:hypothetical protein